MTTGRLIIICGLPGSGKTTLARHLEAETGGVRMCPDEWMAQRGIDIWDSDARAGIEAEQWAEAQALLAEGATVIIEWGTWGRDERDTLRKGARALGAEVELVYLDVPVDELWARIDARGMEAALGSRAMTRADVEEWAGRIEVPTVDELATYDAPSAPGFAR